MALPNLLVSLASEEDASALASIMTAAFSASDAAYPLIWGAAAEGTHDMMSVLGLFTPVQKPDRVTYKAAAEGTGEIWGFASWTRPNSNQSTKVEGEGESKKKDEGVLPRLPGVNVDLWMDKVGGTRGFSERDVDKERDMELSFCFVHPQHQRQGIASSLLSLASQEADSTKSRFWCTSTPQAVRTYEKNGWTVKETHEVDLRKYGGSGTYVRSWMVREPRGD